MTRQDIGTMWSRDTRNALNANFTELYQVQDRAIAEATEAVIQDSKLIWQNPVDVYEDLSTTYPNAVTGYTVMARQASADYNPADENDYRKAGTVWRFNEGVWNAIQDIDPTAYNELDSRLSAQLGNKLNASYKSYINASEFGIVGDGIADDTIALQSALDSLVDGSALYIPKGIYNVRKNTALTDFPHNDQPCLLIRGKKRIKLYSEGAIFKTDTHAQGVLEWQDCSDIVVEGIIAEGAGNFPALDQITGLGEKGTASSGYNTTEIWTYYKNNSKDTSLDFGMYNGGYIGNIAYGFLAHRGCKNITYYKCEAYGFNYAGFGVGHNGNNRPTELNYADSENILYINCYGHDNYSANYSTVQSVNTIWDKCISERSGHPDASINHTYVDPGYGFNMMGSIYSKAKDTSVLNCISSRDKRKGIDGHAGQGLIATKNIIVEALVCGIFFETTNAQQMAYDYDISDNKIYRVGGAKNPSSAISVGGSRGTDYSKDNIVARGKVKNNLIVDSFGVYGIIQVDTYDVLDVSGNQIVGVLSPTSRGSSGLTPTGIYFGYSTPAELNYMGHCKDNMIDAKGIVDLVGGIIVRNLQEGNVSGNIIKLKHAAAQYGIKGLNNDKVNFHLNTVILDVVGTPYDLETNGVVTGNNSTGGNPTSTPLSGQKIFFRINWVDGVRTIYYFSGQRFVDSIVNDTRGIRINLKHTQRGITPELDAEVSGSTGLATTSVWSEFQYPRDLQSDYVIVGLKESRSGSHIEYNSLYNGSIDLKITI